jgi:glycosyltransferase involved in cell wall biosynthesis
MGHDILHVCGGDIEQRLGAGSSEQYGGASFHQQWFRRSKLLGPFIHTASERRDIQHDMAMVPHLAQVCETFMPEVIWERSCRLHCSGLVMARRLGVPYVLEWKDHLVDYRASLFRGKALRMESRKNREADYIVVESGVLRDELGRGGIDVGKIIVAHNAVNAAEFTRDSQERARVRKELGVSDDTVLVGYLGSYAFYHDTARLVLAADIIRKQEAAGRVQILMVGAGKEHQESRTLAEKLGLLDNILMMKPGVPKHEVPGILAALDIAVLPGSTDIICPIKIQEYMACELPSVVPDYACNREVLRDGETGMLFKPKDESALAKKIAILAADQKLREAIGRRAREEVIRRLSWEATWGAALETVLEREREKAAAFASVSADRSPK